MVRPRVSPSLLADMFRILLLFGMIRALEMFCPTRLRHIRHLAQISPKLIRCLMSLTMVSWASFLWVFHNLLCQYVRGSCLVLPLD